MSNDRDQARADCPTDVDLKAFNSGRLPESQLIAIATHLETCSRCTTFVDGLFHNDVTLVDAVRELERCEEMYGDPVFQQLQAFGRALPVRVDRMSGTPPSAGVEPDESTDIARRLGAPETETCKVFESDQPPPRPAKSEQALPERIGEYFILRKLGEGGFGVVYLAKDPRTDTTVAIKVPKPGPSVTEGSIQEFLREARTVGELQHPRIVQVRDFQRLPQFGCCVVMQYFEGGSLERFLARERVGYERAAKWIADLAEALHEVHRRKIYHRDIKPANILLDVEQNPHLSDFGLALLDEDRWLHRDQLAGTLAYMSPEQVQGRTQFMDSRTDIWSLGVILFEMLVRERPFRGRTREEISLEILHKYPSPRVVNAGIPVALEGICKTCLKKDPDQRYTSALDLAADLREWLAAQRIAASPTGVRNRLKPSDAPSPRSDSPVVEARYRASLLPWLAVVLALGAVAVIAFLIIDHRRRTMGPIDQQSLSMPDSAPGAASWLDLLGREPVIVAWERGDGREPPRFDASERLYAVCSRKSRWIARVEEIQSRPVELRAALSVDNWVGFGGIIWGLREDPEAFPEKRYRCLAVEYYRIDATKPAKLTVVEMFLTEHSFDDIRLEVTRPIDVLEILPPEHREALIEVTVEPNRLRVRFDQQWDWEPTDSERATKWLPDGRTAVGLTGQGRETTIRGFSYRYLPAIEEPLR